MVKAVLEGRKTQFRNEIPNEWIQSDEAPIPTHGEDSCIWHFWKFGEKQSKYEVDDILYVKETFNDEGWEYQTPLIFKADIEEKYFKQHWWKPSVYLKQKDARIFLKITNVRVERLQDILLEDMLKEGINHIQSYQNGNIVKTSTQIKREFINSWNSKAKDRYKWEDNPYVFVYEFERINKED